VRSGLSGQTDNTQGNPFPQLAIAEYKVITSNYKAEYDQISSAAVTAETRSGTNHFEGQVFGTYTSDHYRPRHPESSTPIRTSRRLPRTRNSGSRSADRSSRTPCTSS